LKLPRAARALRRLADWLDPPPAESDTPRASPHPTAVANPVELDPVPPNVGESHIGTGGPLAHHDTTPGRWGGPYSPGDYR
jgi:hypothetical protein